MKSIIRELNQLWKQCVLTKVRSVRACFFVILCVLLVAAFAADVQGPKAYAAVYPHHTNLKNMNSTKEEGVYAVGVELFDISAKQLGEMTVLISWQGGDAAANYQVERCVDGESEYTVIKTLGSVTGEQSFTDTNVLPGITYHYRVRKLDNVDVVGESSVVTVRVVLAPPEKLVVDDAAEYPSFTWMRVSGATTYLIYRRGSLEEFYKLVGTTDQLSYVDRDAEGGILYQYYVVASDGDASHDSAPSDSVYKFAAPDSFDVKGVYTKKKVKLSWTEIPAAGYIVYKKNASGKYAKLAETDKTRYVDAKVKQGKTYQYKIAYVINLPDGKILENKSQACSVFASLVDPNKKMVALTFDDGPGKYTQEIVDCLKKNDARATFFVLGCNIDNYKGAVKNAHKIGCEIANHSYDHTILTRISAEQVKKQMKDTDAKVKKLIGTKTVLMRCPGGGVNQTVQNAVGKPIILWSIDTLDWKTRNTDKTISAVMNNVKDGDIVLMHDIHEPTKRAALYLIPQLKKKGYQLVTVSELAKYRGYKLKKGTIYHSLRKK